MWLPWWCGHPGDVIWVTILAVGLKTETEVLGQRQGDPRGVSLLPSGSVWWWLRLGCSGEVKRNGWILNMFWRGNRIFWQTMWEIKKRKNELKVVFELRAWKDRSGHSWDGQDVTRRGQRKRSGVLFLKRRVWWETQDGKAVGLVGLEHAMGRGVWSGQEMSVLHSV